MSYALSPLATSARQLSTWLKVWQVLAIIGGVIGVLGATLLLVSGGALAATLDLGGFGTLLTLIALLMAAAAGLGAWINWRLLRWGQEWTDGAAASAEGIGSPHHLGTVRGHLDRWLNITIWGLLAVIVLAALLSFAAASALGGPGGFPMAALLGVLVFLGFIFVLSIYLPLTALRQFLGQATARLQGASRPVTPAAKRLNTWCIVLVVLQVLGLLSSFFAPTDGDGAGSKIVGLVMSLVSSALYIFPLLLTGKFAQQLAGVLDSGAGGSFADSGASPAPLRDYSNMGRMADGASSPRRLARG